MSLRILTGMVLEFGLISIYCLGWSPISARGQEFNMTEAQFNSWLTNGREAPEDRLDSQLQVEISLINLSCELDPEQRKKLKLAAERDIARFNDQVEQIRQEVVGKTFDQNEVGNLYQRIQPLNQTMQKGFFGPTSLFTKVLPHTLSAEQFQTIEQLRSDQRRRCYQAVLRLYIVGLEKFLPMTEMQRQQLFDVLVESSLPPSSFGQYDWYYAASQVSQIPQEKFEPFFDEKQLKVIQQARQHGRGYKDYVENQGITPFEE